MQQITYVQASDKTPLMPIICKPARVRRLIESGKARIVSTVPFVIRLNYEIPKEYTGRLILGIDPGRTNIGLCVIDEKGHVLYASDVETRNKMIARLMLNRKRARQASRRGRRQVRKRRAKRNHTLMAEQTRLGIRPVIRGHVCWERKLPQCKKMVPVYDIRNTEARFCNRKRMKGWLTPTANQLLQTHISAINKVMKILPITDIVMELNRFSFARMEDPALQGWAFQHGPLYGFDSVDEAVSVQQDHHCIFCKKGITHYHHIVPITKGGSESLQNKAGLCDWHHDLIHKETAWYDKMVEKKAGLEKKYGALSVLNQIIPYMAIHLMKMEPFMQIRFTNGWRTKMIRDSVGLGKTHYTDAWCIAAAALEDPSQIDYPEFGAVYHMMQFRRHDRARIQRTDSRKYLMDGKVVAVNRNKATMAVPKKQKDGTVVMEEKEQDKDSLAEFRQKMVKLHGAEEAERIVSRLQVVKSMRRYRNPDRIMPGAIILVDGERYVMQSQHNNCTRYITGIVGLAALKGEIKSLKKQLTAAKRAGNTEQITALTQQIDRLEVQLPKIPEFDTSKCELLLHNAGLVYVTQFLNREEEAAG